ncbi:MAG: flavin reductase family protein [Brevefilum sp.]|nr:flavin reductase family protein [Brevefilum sp.]
MSDHIHQEQLKQVMRSWITGVAIVTACQAGVFHGMTVNSFTSIALSPPTVMVALQQSTRTQQAVNAGRAFGVTILGIDQETLAKRFAGQMGEDQPRFAGLDTFTMVTGAPLIKGGLAYLDCQVVNAFDVGASTVFFGEVLASQSNADGRAPLLYFNRDWRRLANR